MRVCLPPGFLAFSLALSLAAVPCAAAAGEASDFARYLGSAVQLYRTGDYTRALEQLESARKEPHRADDDVLAWLWRGILLDELDDEAAACEAFRTALSLDLAAQLPVQVRQRIGLHFELEREKLRQLQRQAATVSPPVAPPPPPSAASAATRPSDPTPLRLWAIAPLAAGAAVAIAGGVTLGVAKDRYDALESGEAWAGDAAAYRDSGKVLQAVGWTLTAAGVAAAVVGAVVLALPAEAAPARIGLAPALVPGGAGVLVSGVLP